MKKISLGFILAGFISNSNAIDTHLVEEYRVLNPFYSDNIKVIDSQSDFKKAARNVLIRDFAKTSENCYAYANHEVLNKTNEEFYSILYCNHGDPLVVNPGSLLKFEYLLSENDKPKKIHSYVFELNSRGGVKINFLLQSDMSNASFLMAKETLRRLGNLHLTNRKDIIRNLRDFKDKY